MGLSIAYILGAMVLGIILYYVGFAGIINWDAILANLTLGTRRKVEGREAVN